MNEHNDSENSNEDYNEDHNLKGLIDNLKSNKLSIKDFVSEVSGISWGDLEWGSCQYDTAVAMFRTLDTLNANGYDPTEIIGWGKIDTLIKNNVDKKMILLRLLNDRVVDVNEMLSEANEEEDYNYYFAKLTTLKEHIASVKSDDNVKDIDIIFKILRKSSWDLWSAADHVCNRVFGTNFGDLKSIMSPGVGPSLNVAVQSGNNLTALQCYMLYRCGYVSNPDVAFNGFDT